MAKVIAFSNQKGGVGKTTSCVNIAAALGKRGKRVLLIDIDPQGNATSGLGVGKKNIRHTVYDVILGETPVQDAIIITKFKNLHVIPSTVELAGAEMDLHAPDSQGANALRVVDSVRENYDYILIDCPPSLGMLTVNALAYADGVIIPERRSVGVNATVWKVSAGAAARVRVARETNLVRTLEGMSQLLITIKKVRRSFNENLEITGILLTMYNGRLSLTKQVVDELKKYYADKIFKTPISRSVRLSEAPSFGAPICYYDPTSKCADEYDQVAQELIALG